MSDADPGRALVDQLRDELRLTRAALSRLAVEGTRAAEAERAPEMVALYGTGALLHGYYTALERFLGTVARDFDAEPPQGADWHRRLLIAAASDRPGRRPPILENATLRSLDRYLRFRHLFRNLYVFDLDWEELRPLLLRFLAQLAPPRSMTPANLAQLAPPRSVTPANLAQLAPPRSMTPANLAQLAPPRSVTPANLAQLAPPRSVTPANLAQLAPPRSVTPANLAQLAPSRSVISAHRAHTGGRSWGSRRQLPAKWSASIARHGSRRWVGLLDGRSVFEQGIDEERSTRRSGKKARLSPYAFQRMTTKAPPKSGARETLPSLPLTCGRHG